MTPEAAAASKPYVRFPLELHDGIVARHSFEHVVTSPCSAEETFDFLCEIASDAEWFPDFVAGEWETPAPHGVGSERWFQSDLLWLHERIVAWDRGARFAFIGTQTTLPLMRRFAEEYLFTPTPDGGCRVTWRILYTPRAVFVPLHPILRPVFAKMFAEAAEAMREALVKRAAAQGKSAA